MTQSQSEWLQELLGLVDDHGHWRWETGAAEQAGRTKAALASNNKAQTARAALLAHASARPAAPQAQPPALSDERIVKIGHAAGLRGFPSAMVVRLASALLAEAQKLTPAHSKSEYARRVALGDPTVLPPSQKPTPDTEGAPASAETDYTKHDALAFLVAAVEQYLAAPIGNTSDALVRLCNVKDRVMRVLADGVNVADATELRLGVAPTPQTPALSEEDRDLLERVEATLRREWNGLSLHKFQLLHEKLKRNAGVDTSRGGQHD